MKKSLMSKNIILAFLITFTLASCNSNKKSDVLSENEINESNSSKVSEVSETSSSSDGEKVEASYKLEDGETYTKSKITVKELDSLTYDTIKITGIDSLVVDPFDTISFMGDIVSYYPTSSLLNGKNILYTSCWYEQKTFKREDNSVEYVLNYQDDSWKVISIFESSETFIPFNGAVLSLPSSSLISFKKGDVINIEEGKIPQYAIGFYNQDGKRIAVSAANKLTWQENGINLYDDNTLANVTPLSNYQVLSMNLLYDEEDNIYKVSKFRKQEKKGAIYTNVNQGFVLASTLNSYGENLAVIEGVRFNLDDEIKVEENTPLLDIQYKFSLQETNSVTLNSGKVVDFSIEKTTNNNSSCWDYEVAVNKDGNIIDTNAFVDVPEDGYKLILVSKNTSIDEDVNLVLDDYFPLGASVEINKNDVIIKDNPFYKMDSLYVITKNYYENLMEKVTKENYAYDIERIENSKKVMDDIYSKSFGFMDSEDPTYLYYLYTLTGTLFKQYYNLLNASNRNEAVQVRSVWYIASFADNDSSLENIQKHLDLLKENGVNEIILDVYDNGKAYYSNSNYFQVHQKVSNKDYGEYNNDWVKAISAEAHKRNIKVFACVSPFTRGLENTFSELKNSYALDINGKNYTSNSQGYVQMLDPSSPTVVEKIQLVIEDILSCNENIDGIQLDVIRFGAENNEINTVLGVTDDARVGFNSYCNENNLSYNYSSLDDFRNGLKNDAGSFETFNKYQQTVITNIVKDVKDICLEHDKPLTCAVADNYERVKTWKCQDWGLWAKTGIVDALYLMDYYLDEYYVDYYFKDMVKATNNSCMLVAGIDPSYASLISEYYAKIMKGALKEKESLGYAIFGSHSQLSKKDGWDLVNESNWIDALSPYDSLDKTMKASADLLLKRCDDIYIKYGNMTNAQKEILENDLNTLLASIKDDSYQTSCNVVSYIETMLTKEYASSSANDRIVEQLDTMLQIAKLKQNILK